MGLQVIGSGFGRTGTASLRRALEILGLGPCYHMFEIRDRPGQARAWLKVIDVQPDWEGIFSGYESTVDWPGAAFYRELMEANPSAKLILTIRDPQKWHQSVRATIYELYRILPFWISLPGSPLRPMIRLLRSLIWEGTFKGRFEDRSFATGVFSQHNDRVRQIVPPERLLVYRVQDGWEPLCSFLGKPIPSVEFPHINLREEIQRSIKVVKAIIWLIRIIVFPLGLIELCLHLYRSSKRSHGIP